ncbi:hypothetical protein FSARC_1068 [Fusarium sarcochroum]|uniref:Nephrocystin 3-like N-terminal domain-containing protein n=1 Tax=Fusarium sarcochroum TaxID=1208366 RepID=A0A8H4XFJ3_9HYPO|nr:hypothetical protein FSARC_1068 [Fusarium sarcochroum]
MVCPRLESALMLERNPWEQAFQRLPEDSRLFLIRIKEESKTTTNADHIVNEIVELIHRNPESTVDEHSILEPNVETAQPKKPFVTSIRWLHKYIAIGDGAVQHDTDHALLPWLAIRSFIQKQTVLDNEMAETEQLELICRLMQQSRHLQVRYNAANMEYLRERAHEHLANLWSSLISLYTLILESLVCISFNAQQDQPSRKDVQTTETVKPRNYLDELNVQGQCLEKQAISCHQIYSEESFHRLNQSFQAVTKRALENLPRVIAPPEGNDYHLLLQDNRSADACAWILNDPGYKDWKQWVPRVAILYGPLSRIIDDLRMTSVREGLAHGVAYSYFRHDRELRDSDSLGELENIIKKFIRQLGVKPVWHPGHEGPGVYKPILSLRPSPKFRGSRLGISQCRKVLSELIDEYATVTFVLDALNECEPSERQAVLDFLDDLVRQHYPRVRVFCSSRHDVEVERHFVGRPIVKIEAVSRQDDIASLIYSEILSTKNRTYTKQLPDESRELKAKISQVILDNDDTSLQLASLQLRYLSSSSTTEEIQQRLEELPMNLDALYHRMFNTIQEQDVDRDLKILTAMKWILCLKAPLPQSPYSLILPLNPTTDVPFSHDNPKELYTRITNTTLNQLSLNILADCDPDIAGGHCFHHLSDCKYFEQYHCSLQAAELFVATSCLKWFLFETEIGREYHYGVRIFRLQLQLYWLDHLDYGEAFDPVGEKRLVRLLKLFLGSFDTASTHFVTWNEDMKAERAKTLPSRFKQSIYSRLIDERPIILVCLKIPYRLLSDWWEDTSVDLDQCSSKGQTLLELSLLFKNTSVWRFLLRRKVSVNHGLLTPLNVAIKNQITEAIELLLDAGADVNRMGPLDCRTCLSEAVRHDDLETMRKLIDRGADINHQHILQESKDHYATSPLFEACIGAEDAQTIRLLLDNGANINEAAPQGCRYSSPLHAALCMHNWSAAKVLLEYGVDTRLGNSGENILDIIDKPACHPILGELIDIGLSPKNLHQCLIETITGSCCRRSPVCVHRREVFQRFLDIGADINGTDGGRSPTVLAVAAYECDIPVIVFLLNRGADINLVSDSPLQETALCAAASQGWIDTVKFLIMAGADVNKGTRSVTPLIRTFTIESDEIDGEWDFYIDHWTEEEERYLECARLLIQAGANVNAVCPEGLHGTALSAASFMRSMEGKNLLINSGAEITLTSPWQSPLCAFVKSECSKRLSKLGADCKVNPDTILPRGFGSALAVAAYYAIFDEVYVLLRRQRADPNLELKAWFKNALEAAMYGSIAEAKPPHIVRQRYLFVIRLLLSAGAKPPMLILKSLELPVEYVLRQSGQDYRIHSAIASHKWPLGYSMTPLSPTWGGIICELTATQPRRFREALRRWSFPSDLPAFYVVAFKLEPIDDSGVHDSRFAFILLWENRAKFWFWGRRNLSPSRHGALGASVPKPGQVNRCGPTPTLRSLALRTAVAVAG